MSGGAGGKHPAQINAEMLPALWWGEYANKNIRVALKQEMKNCNITKTFPRADIQALCQLFKNTVNNSAEAAQYGSSCVKWTNGTLPENMKISKLLLFKERHNFAQKKCAVHRSKNQMALLYLQLVWH